MKKAILILLVLVSALGIFSKYALAANPLDTWNYPQERKEYGDNGNAASGVYMENSLTHFLGILAGGLGATQLLTDDLNLQKQYAQNTILGKTTQGISFLYAQPPAHFSTYIADLKGRIGFPTKSAYAQGIGFQGLDPILPIWKAFRNISYGFIIIVMILVGFMMMFRMKIDPRTVVTVQNAIPRIIITLISITFSYAIVGIMIDIMYLFIYVVLLAIGRTDQNVVQHFTGGPLTHLIGTTFSTGVGAIGDLVQFLGLGWNQGNVINVITTVVGTGVGIATLGPLGLLVGPVAGAALPQALLYVLVIIALIFLMLRIFFMLLSAWIQVFISLIFGPLQLMFGAIPGVGTFGSWFKNLTANLMTFPITAILLFISTYLTGKGDSLAGLWRPPGLGGTTGQGVAGLIGLGMLLIIPNLVNNFKQALKVQSALPIGPGTFTGGVFGGVGSLFQLAYQAKFLGLSLPFGRKKLPTANTLPDWPITPPK